jgi:hypothetical protein
VRAQHTSRGRIRAETYEKTFPRSSALTIPSVPVASAEALTVPRSCRFLHARDNSALIKVMSSVPDAPADISLRIKVTLSDPDAPADKRTRVRAVALAATVALVVGAVLVLVSAPCSSAEPAALFSARRAWRAVPQRVRTGVTVPARFTLRAQMTLRGLKPRALEKVVDEAFEEPDPLDGDGWLTSSRFSSWRLRDELPDVPRGDEITHNTLLQKRVAEEVEEPDHLDGDGWLTSSRFSSWRLRDEIPEEPPQGDELMHTKLLGASALAPAPTVSTHSVRFRAYRSADVCRRAISSDPTGCPLSLPQARSARASVPPASSASSSRTQTRTAPTRSTRTRSRSSLRCDRLHLYELPPADPRPAMYCCPPPGPWRWPGKLYRQRRHLRWAKESPRRP